MRAGDVGGSCCSWEREIDRRENTWGGDLTGRATDDEEEEG